MTYFPYFVGGIIGMLSGLQVRSKVSQVPTGELGQLAPGTAWNLLIYDSNALWQEAATKVNTEDEID